MNLSYSISLKKLILGIFMLGIIGGDDSEFSQHYNAFLELLLIFVFFLRFVAAMKNVSAKEELDHTTDMINTNFSNYSAWHNRRCIYIF